MEEKRERIVFLDLLRITAIFAMVFLHIFAGDFLGMDSGWRMVSPSTAAWQIFNVYDCLMRFCVPVFCMISGILFLDPDRDVPMKKLFSKNIRRIVFAFVFWSPVYAVLGVLLRGEHLGLQTVIDMVKRTVFGHYHLWFLLMLLGFYLVVPLLRRITADKRLAEYFLILTFVFTFLQNALLLIAPLKNLIDIQAGKMSLYMVTGFVGYFVLGSYLYRYPPRTAVRHGIYLLGILSFVGTAAATGVISFFSGKPNDELYGYLLPNTLFEATAVYLFFAAHFGNRTFSPRATARITTLSSCCFGIYLVHDLVNMLLHRLGITAAAFLPALSVPVLAAAVFAVSFGIAYLLRKIPLFRDYLM